MQVLHLLLLHLLLVHLLLLHLLLVLLLLHLLLVLLLLLHLLLILHLLLLLHLLLVLLLLLHLLHLVDLLLLELLRHLLRHLLVLLSSSIGMPLSMYKDLSSALSLVGKGNGMFSILALESKDAKCSLSDLLVTLEGVLIPDRDVEELVLLADLESVLSP